MDDNQASSATSHSLLQFAARPDTSYGMGWFVGPVNGIPAVFHQGETFNYHANIVLLPGSHQGVVLLMNAENSADLFVRGRMGTISEGVASLLAGRKLASPPSNTGIFVVYALLLAAIVLQIRGMIRSAAALRRRRRPTGRFGPKTRTVVALARNLGWAGFVLVLLPKQMGAPLPILAQGLPDLAYALMVSGMVALCWSVLRTVWAVSAYRKRETPRRVLVGTS